MRLRPRLLASALSGFLMMTMAAQAADSAPPPAASVSATARPALTVTVIQPRRQDLMQQQPATGSIEAWDEAVIGADVNGLRLSDVAVRVGDQVRKGQILARFESSTVRADLGQTEAAVAEAEAARTQAQSDAERARAIGESGSLSAQQRSQYETNFLAADARLRAAKAQRDAQALRRDHCEVLAPDDGVISARSATLGAVAGPGQELFRLIRQNRLEWRAEVTAAELPGLAKGQNVTLTVPGLPAVTGKVRTLPPSLSSQTRTGLVLVDLPLDASGKGYRPGMFGQGIIEIGKHPALVIPQEALSLRDGFPFVFKLTERQGDRARIAQVKLTLGRRDGAMVEVASGLSAEDVIVAQGAAFLGDGDLVRVVTP